jgi:hypothetical protein
MKQLAWKASSAVAAVLGGSNPPGSASDYTIGDQIAGGLICTRCSISPIWELIWEKEVRYRGYFRCPHCDLGGHIQHFDSMNREKEFEYGFLQRRPFLVES